MRRQPAAHAPPDARRLNRRALLTLSGAAGLAGGLLAIERAEAGEPPRQPEAAGSDDGGLTPHREAYYRRARF